MKSRRSPFVLITLLGSTFILCFVTLTATAQEATDSEGFRPMFTDVDLSGWVLTNTPRETWSWEEAMLKCTGKPIGEIRTDRMYQNFILELEWRHMVPAGNAGIFVWADDITSRGVPFHRGIEVQVLENAYGNNRSHTTHGDIFPIHGASMTPENGHGGQRAFPTENRSNPSPEWNHYRIVCNDGEISLAVNGKVVTKGKDCIPRKGYICIESEGGVVHYRNIRIKELPSSEIDPSHVAIADRGYRSIYTGLDLSGWKTDESSSWTSNDWILEHRGDEDAPSVLESSETVDRIGMVADVRLNSPESSAVVSAGPGIMVDLTSDQVAPHLEKHGRWNRIEAWQDGEKWVLKVNETKVAWEPGSPQQVGRKGILLTATGSVDFCNLYVRNAPE